jgi:hypothetical protein
MSNQSSYNLLIEKLDQFIRKYYLNQLLKGFLYTIALVLVLFLVFNILEYNFYFSQVVRKLFFFSFLGLSLGAIGFYIVKPIVKYFKLGKVISYEQSASIIGTHFGDVQDKLLNILQLKKQSNSLTDNSLIEASINQKTEEIKVVPFKSAIDFASNRKYLKYALPPMLLLVVLIFAAPSIITDSTNRIINNNKTFEREAPFKFIVKNENLEAVQYSDFTLDIEVDGKILPNEVFVEIDNFLYRVEKKDANTFTYQFKNVQKATDFKLVSGTVKGKEYLLNVIEKPSLSDFSLFLDYPRYTQRKDEKLKNIGDVIIPEGTKVAWELITKNTDKVGLKFNNEPINDLSLIDDKYNYQKLIREDLIYKMFIQNNKIPSPDSISYQINVIKDQYPTIEVERIDDSTNVDLVYFLGNIADDYGINSLTFNYQIVDEKGNLKTNDSKTISTKRQTEEDFTYMFDVNDISLNNGEEVRFFFEVKDNDGVNGSKSAKSTIMNFRKTSLKEIQEEQDKKEEEIKDNLKESLKDIEKMQENFKKMREKLLQKKELEFQDKKELEKIMEQQKELQQKLENAKDNFDKNKESQKQLNQQKEEILEKQEKLEELFEKVLDPETKELMEKIEELLQELEKEDAVQMMEQFEMNNENLEKNMDRLLDLYKQLEMEKEVKEQIEKLEELAEKQEELAEKTESEKEDTDKLKEEQEEIKKEFEEVEKKMEELQKKNEELNPPKDLGDKKENEEQMDDIQEDMEQSEDQLEQKDSKGASKSQKGAAKKMKKMAGNLQSSMEGGEQEQNEEDIKALRQLLENLVTLSFDQENLIADFNETGINTPRYVDLTQGQFKLKDDFKLIEDSLTALSSRVTEIETFVIEKVTEIKFDFKESLERLEERNLDTNIRGKRNAKMGQRSIMTNVNDLALMLAESMANMQKDMASSMPGSQMCNKPGGQGQGKNGKVPKDKISEGQQGLNEDMKGIKEKLQKGEGTAKDFAEAAARQAALRKALQDLKNEKQEQGKGGQELQEIINDMNKVETDLVNKRFDAEVLKRQKDIETRLLEAEKADRQREFDNKRKSEQGKDVKKEMPPAILEYLKKRETEVEMYKSTSPALKPYYKNLVDEYFKALRLKN